MVFTILSVLFVLSAFAFNIWAIIVYSAPVFQLWQGQLITKLREVTRREPTDP